MGLLPALGNWARGYLWGEGNDPIPYRAPSWKPPILTSFPPMASNIFSSWTRSCWMLFIRMQG